MPPRVAHFVPLYLPLTETFVYSVITRHRRWQPFVAAQHRVPDAVRFPFPDLWIEDELRAERWSTFSWRRRFAAYVLRRRESRWETLLRSKRARVLHVHFGHTGAEMIGLSRKLGIPQVTAFYGWDDTVPMRDPKRRAGFAQLFREGEAFLVEGGCIAKRLEEHGCRAERIHVHRIGIDLEGIPFEPAEISRGEPVRVLFCGRFVEKKGLDDALVALRAARDAGLDLCLRAIGDGPLRPEVEGRIAALDLGAHVTLLGARGHGEFLDELGRCHLFIQPSRTASDGDTEGGAPTVLIEAQASGKPIVATEHADIPEIVVPGTSAVLVPEAEPAALARALIGLASHPERWREMGAAGRRHVEHEHEIGRQMERLESLYDTLERDR